MTTEPGLQTLKKAPERASQSQRRGTSGAYPDTRETLDSDGFCC
jgi:hypothetical protein